MTTNHCQCSVAGFCGLYERNMSARAHSICNGSSGLSESKAAVYRSNWQRVKKSGSSLPGKPSCETCGEKSSNVVQKKSAIESVTGAALKWVQSGSPLRTTEELTECLTVCRDCPEYQLHPIARCKSCGCFLSAKARMATEDCPLGKWPALTRAIVPQQPKVIEIVTQKNLDGSYSTEVYTEPVEGLIPGTDLSSASLQKSNPASSE